MKAFTLPDNRSAATFLDIAVPDPGPGDVRVAVKASSVNGFDVFVASGMARGMMEHRYPVVVGKDFAGVVDAVGEGVERFSVGSEVTGIAPPEEHVGRGAYAEFIVVPANGFIEPKPATLSFEQAASVGLSALTGMVAVDAVGASDGHVVLVTGATGGVGSYAVQIAAALGATVIATSLPDDESWIRSLGASEVVDYRGDVARSVRGSHPDGIDALIDAVNMGDAHNSVAGLVKDGGHVVSTTGSADEDGLSARGVGATNVFAQSDPARFANVIRMAADGDLQVPIRQTFSFDELPQALGLVGERSSRGKFAVAIAKGGPMSERIAPSRFHELDWRIVRDDACTHFRTGSFAAGVALVDSIGRLAAGADLEPDVDLRSDSVTVRLSTHGPGWLNEGHVDLARQISATARELDVSVDLTGLQNVQIAIDALVIPDVLPFWRAVLGYRQVDDEDLADPHFQGPPLWFQQMDAPRSQRNRIHIDVYVPHDQAETRVAAAIAAGGHVVSDENAPEWWTLADPEGNEVDVAPWPDRD